MSEHYYYDIRDVTYTKPMNPQLWRNSNNLFGKRHFYYPLNIGLECCEPCKVPGHKRDIDKYWNQFVK